MNFNQTNHGQTGLGVIIPGAGTSSRMGRPKLLLPWQDTTVIGHHIRQWRMLGAVQIGVVCRPDDRGLQVELNRLGFPPDELILNPQPEQGMFSSIQCAANWGGWHPEIRVWAVVLGDQPQVRFETLRQLLAFQRGHPGEICQPAYEGRPRHPVMLPAWAFRQLQTAPGGTLKDFLKLYAGRCVQCSMDDPGLRLDMDTPEDYKQIHTEFSGT